MNSGAKALQVDGRASVKAPQGKYNWYVERTRAASVTAIEESLLKERIKGNET